MKILFLTSSMQGGGAERVAALLANAWATIGHQVTLMPTFSARGDCVYRLAETVQLEFLSDHCEAGAGRLARLKTLRRFIRTLRPHVIVSFLPHVNIAALLAARGTGIPVIVCERTYPPLLQPPLPMSYRILRRLTYPWAAALVSQTQATGEWLRRRAPRTKIAVIANPVVLPMNDSEPVIYPGTSLRPNDRLLLWVGRMDAAKRPQLIIDAFVEIAASAPDWRLVMLGDGPLRQVMQDRATEAGFSDRISLPGFAGNLGSWYQRADIYVMTSSYEGFPNSMLEAMSHGTAAVAFDVPTGPAELSDGGRRLALLPDDEHVARLVPCLTQLMQNADKRASLAAEAHEVVEAFSVGSILAQWNNLFAEVASGDQDLVDPRSS
jgi:glycosyltransferase involved in cell wall biosynthesis